MIDRAAFKLALGPLLSMFGDPSNGDAAFWEVYYRACAHLPPDTLNAAIMHVVQTHVYNTFPKPAVLLDAARLMLGGRTGADAWGDVTRAIAEHGYYRPPEGYTGNAEGAIDMPSYRWTFSDPLVLEGVIAMGWRRLCFSDNPGTDAAQFAKIYDSLKERKEAGALALSSPGSHPAPRLEGRGTALIAQLAQAKKVTP